MDAPLSPWAQRIARTARTIAAGFTSKDLERDITDVVATELAEVCDGVGLYAADVPGGTLTLLHARGRIDGLPRTISFDVDHVVARTAVSRQPTRAGGQLGFPLVVADELAGVLALACAPRRDEDADDTEALGAIADVVALAFAGARARRRSDELSLRIHKSTLAERAILDAIELVPESQLHVALLRGFHIWPYAREENVPTFVRGALQAIADQARLAVGAQMAALGIVRGPDKSFEPWVYSGVPEEQAAAIGRAPRPVGTLGAVALSGASLRVRDVRAHPSFLGLPPHHPPLTSMLAVPIRYGQLSVGNLYVANKLDAPEFSVEDGSLLEGLANNAAHALQIAFLRTAIESQRAQLQSTLDCAPSGILFIDAETQHVMANPRAMALIGRTIVPDSGVSQYLDLVCHPDGRRVSLAETPFMAALAGNTVRNVEGLICAGDGHRIPVLVSAAPVRTVDDHILGAVVMFEDISAVKDLERARAEFAAVVAHDLRTPLTVIQLQISALLRDVDGNQVRAPLPAVRRIQRSASELVQMTNDLLDATRTELGRFALERTEVEVDHLTEDIVEQLRLALEHHPIELLAEPGLPHVMLDRLRFEQLLTNLVDNAAKHSPEHTPISIHLARADDGIAIAVEDHGSGIPAAEIPMLFDRYYQTSRSRSKRSGLGLGLYIVKGIVDAHEGKIWVESQPGRGTTFHLWFPAGPRVQPAAELSQHPA